MKKLFFVILALLVTSLSFGVNCPTSLAANPTPPPSPIRPVGGMCDLGNNPAATLLIPYFEVDSTNSLGLDTLIGIVNLSNNYIVAHVILWNVDSWPLFDFNIVLTNWDVVTFSMKDIFIRGVLPNNCCATNSSRFRVAYVDCDGDGNYFSQIAPAGWLTDSFGIACYQPFPHLLAQLQCAFSIGSYDGPNDNYVGYITIDAHITCSGAMPTYDSSYFEPDRVDTNNDGIVDHGLMENSNVLMGDIIYYDNANNQSDGMPAVHIEAFGEHNGAGADGVCGTADDQLGGQHCWGMQARNPNNFAALGINTFYFKYEGPWWGLPPYDGRENLPLRWAFRYIGNEVFNGGTWVDVWRSHYPGFDHWYVPDPNGCAWIAGGGYSVLYDYVHGLLGLHRPWVICYDEDENTTTVSEDPSHPGTVGAFDELYLESQRVVVRIPEWPLPGQAGFCAIAFDTDAMYDTGPGYGWSFDQSWVNVRYSALNKYTVGLSGISYLNGCALVWNPTTASFVPTPTH